MINTNDPKLHPLGWDAETLRAMAVFRPYAMDKITWAAKENRRFSHYTSAATASIILESSSIRLRPGVGHE